MDNLIEVKDLKMYFPVTSGDLLPKKVAEVKAVDGVSFAIRRGDVDQGKMSIIGGAIIAAAPAVIFAFFKIFGLDANSAVGVGNF